MGKVEYDHFQGDKLTTNEMNRKLELGWILVHHHCRSDDVHNYTFKRKKE